ncbi:MAG: DnaJ domain-containing protein [Candidatus Sumerlaeia bacterium]|nr:DnaJ domain-containing protein [Candidatus Sumerlaeia bacterium]
MARSIAERLARKADMDGTVFDSAGVKAPKAAPPNIEAASFLRMEKIDILRHRSKPVSPQLADSSDIILAMTADITAQLRESIIPEYAPKIVLLNEAVDLSTKIMDILPPSDGSIAAIRRLYASLLAGVGRLVRTLEDPGACPEWFGAKSMERKFKVGSRSSGARASAATIDPEKRQFIANFLFDFLERSFEPPTITQLIEAVGSMGHRLGQLEIEELMRQDLHGFVRQDRQGCWVLRNDATKRRRDEAREKARARNAANQAKARSETEDEEKLTPSLAYKTLGITKETEVEEARRKYRALLKRYHPDKFHVDNEFREMAERKARRINEAWDLIKGELTQGQAT